MRGKFFYQQFGMVLALLIALGTVASAKTTSAGAKKAAASKHSSKTHAVAARSSHAKATSGKASSLKASRGKHGKRVVAKKSWKSKGQKTIASERTREIQEALIREHYLDGQADGQWDPRTQAAMRRFQSQQGWQTKVLPDSRALIKLGLGPDHSDVLNPETAVTSPYLPGGGEKSSVMNTISPATSVVRNR